MQVLDLSGNGNGSFSVFPHDWTEGTGVFPISNVIAIPRPTNGSCRRWLSIQNQGPATITVSYQALNSYGAAVTASLLLAPGAGAGSQGGGDERAIFVPSGSVTITGVSGNAVQVLEVCA